MRDGENGGAKRVVSCRSVPQRGGGAMVDIATYLPNRGRGDTRPPKSTMMFWLAWACLTLPELAGHSQGRGVRVEKGFFRRYLPLLTAMFVYFSIRGACDPVRPQTNSSVHSSALECKTRSLQEPAERAESCKDELPREAQTAEYAEYAELEADSW